MVSRCGAPTLLRLALFPACPCCLACLTYICGLGLCLFNGLVCDLLLRGSLGLSMKAHRQKSILFRNCDVHCLEDTEVIWCLSCPGARRRKGFSPELRSPYGHDQIRGDAFFIQSFSFFSTCGCHKSKISRLATVATVASRSFARLAVAAAASGKRRTNWGNKKYKNCETHKNDNKWGNVDLRPLQMENREIFGGENSTKIVRHRRTRMDKKLGNTNLRPPQVKIEKRIEKQQ